MPKPSTPALLLMVVRFFVPLRASARIRFSGIPHRPKPPTMMVAPSNTSWIASSALATTLFMAEEILSDEVRIHHGRGRELMSFDCWLLFEKPFRCRHNQ